MTLITDTFWVFSNHFLIYWTIFQHIFLYAWLKFSSILTHFSFKIVFIKSWRDDSVIKNSNLFAGTWVQLPAFISNSWQTPGAPLWEDLMSFDLCRHLHTHSNTSTHTWALSYITLINYVCRRVIIFSEASFCHFCPIV